MTNNVRLATASGRGVSREVFRRAVRAILLAFVATACDALPRGAQTTDLAISRVLPSLIERADSVAIAGAVYRECGDSSGWSACYESLLVPIGAAGKVSLAMGTLNRLGTLDANVRRDGHVFAHAIGIAAGQAGSDVASAFKQCTETFQSGCYHGVIQAFFTRYDSVGAKEANELCEPFRASEAERWVRFQCVHGMGHGLMAIYAHDLQRGLEGCDLLLDSWDRRSCYGGVFMENIVNATMPHHPAARIAGRAASPDSVREHDHHVAGAKQASPATPYKAIDPADPLYPCSAVADQYLAACYEMQTSVILHLNHGDIAAAARTCDTAPPSMRAVCYKSLGRDASAYSAQDHSESIRLCSLGSVAYQPWCYYGLVKNFIDMTARPGDGLAFCGKLPAGASKAVCHIAVGEQILVLVVPIEDRRAVCVGSDPDYLGACLFGARVTSVPPPGLAEVLRSTGVQSDGGEQK